MKNKVFFILVALIVSSAITLNTTAQTPAQQKSQQTSQQSSQSNNQWVEIGKVELVRFGKIEGTLYAMGIGNRIFYQVEIKGKRYNVSPNPPGSKWNAKYIMKAMNGFLMFQLGNIPIS